MSKLLNSIELDVATLPAPLKRALLEQVRALTDVEPTVADGKAVFENAGLRLRVPVVGVLTPRRRKELRFRILREVANG